MMKKGGATTTLVMAVQQLLVVLSFNFFVGRAFAFVPPPNSKPIRLFPSHSALIRTTPIRTIGRRQMPRGDLSRYQQYIDDGNNQKQLATTTECNDVMSEDLSDSSPREEEQTRYKHVQEAYVQKHTLELVSNAYANGELLIPKLWNGEREAFQSILKANKIEPSALPLGVSDALFCYFATGNVDAVRKDCKEANDIDLRLFVRENPENDHRGQLCVLQYKDMQQLNDGSIRPVVVEYYATPILDANSLPMSIVERKRIEFPVSSANLAKLVAIQAGLLAAGLIGSTAFRVPIRSCWRPRALFLSACLLPSSIGNAMKNHLLSIVQNDPITIVPLAIVSSVFVVLILSILASAKNLEEGNIAKELEEKAKVTDEANEWDVDWLQKVPRATVASLSTMLGIVGTKTESSTVHSYLVSFLMGVLPGVSEELLFRGFLQTALSRSLGAFPAIVLQAALFGLAHGGYRSKAYVLLCSIAGFIFGQVYSLTGNLALPMLLHAVFNFNTAFQEQQLLKSMTIHEISSLITLTPRKRFPMKSKEGTAIQTNEAAR